MNTLNIWKLGLATGLTMALMYLGCVIVMAALGREGTVLFFNSILHGIDVAPVLRTDMPFSEMAMGIVEIFILGWLTGAVIAGIYNFRAKKK
jgi:hypothetical protein